TGKGPGQAEAPAGFGPLGSASLARDGGITGHERRHLAAHPGPVGEVKVEDAVKAEVAAGLGEAGDETGSKVRPASGLEPHRQEGQLVRHVPAAEPFVELDGDVLEPPLLPGKEIDVLQTKISMPLPDAILLDADHEPRSVSDELGP